jgi:nucleoside 2-deoxyribosyltransferase
MYIYEIGAITHYARNSQIHKAITWRTYLDRWAEDNCIKTFNPITTYVREINHTYDSRLCVDQNDYYINKCDIAVANMDSIDYSPGSIYELVRFRELRKPVIAFGATKHWSPHINSCISNWCESLDDVKILLSNMFM